MKNWRVTLKVESDEGDSFSRVSEPFVIDNPLYFAEQVEKMTHRLHSNVRKSIIAVYGNIEEVRSK